MGKDDGSRAPLSRLRWWHALAPLAALIVAAFYPALRAPFIFDDFNTVVWNEAMRTPDFDSFFSDPMTFSVKTGNWPYRPAVMALSSLLYQAAGYSAPAWHGFQLLVHILNVCMVALLGRHVFGLRKGALLGAALFGLAPLQCQAVCYVSARSMVFALGPALVSVYALVAAARAATERGSILWKALAVASALPALFSSEGAMALPLWLALGAWAGGADWRRNKAWTVPAAVILLALAYFGARYFTSPIRGLGAHPRLEPPFTAFENAGLQLAYPFAMLKLWLFPKGLNMLHHPGVPESAADVRFLGPVAGMAAAFFVVYIYRGHRTLAAGLLWYFLSLLPAVLVPLNIAWAEHRAYLALPGLCWALGRLLELLFCRLGDAGAGGGGSGRGRLWAARLALALSFLFLALLARERALVWTEEDALFRDMVMKSPEYDIAWAFLAAEAREDLDNERALRYLDRALRLESKNADAWSSRADLLLRSGRKEEAVGSARRAVELDPANGTYWNNLAMALVHAGRPREAEQVMKEALERLAPYDPNRRVIENNWRRLQMDLDERR